MRIIWMASWLLFSSSLAQAAIVDVTVTFDNLAPANSIGFAPIHVGFNNGSFDGFDINSAAPPSIAQLAETGSGAAWFADFSAADPGAVLGSLGGGPIIPGGSVTQTFRVDTDVNQFFTFAGMVLPSNDLFVGNDNPQGIQLLDASGSLLLNQINLTAASIWDAGSEQAIAQNAAFIAGSNAGDRVPENDVVTFDFSELAVYDGLQTGAGYNFDAGLISAATPISSLSFSVSAVPEPSSLLALGVAAIGGVLRRRRVS